MKWETLGQATHHLAHLTLALRHDRRYALPQMSSTSFMAIGHARPASYPNDAMVYALDARQGRTDFDVENKATVTALMGQLSGALDLLREWTAAGELYARAVNDLCVLGCARLYATGWRHTGQAYEQFMMRHGIADARTLQRWLAVGWEMVGLVIARPEIREAAIMRRAVNVEALEWLRERGVL